MDAFPRAVEPGFVGDWSLTPEGGQFWPEPMTQEEMWRKHRVMKAAREAAAREAARPRVQSPGLLRSLLSLAANIVVRTETSPVSMWPGGPEVEWPVQLQWEATRLTHEISRRPLGEVWRLAEMGIGRIPLGEPEPIALGLGEVRDFKPFADVLPASALPGVKVARSRYRRIVFGSVSRKEILHDSFSTNINRGSAFYRERTYG